jgi:hypothetical protein
LERVETSFKWEARIMCLIPIGLVVLSFNEKAGYTLFGLTTILVLFMDAVFSVTCVWAFLLPIRKTLREGVEVRNQRVLVHGETQLNLRSDVAFERIMKTKWTTLAGCSLAVLSSSVLYLNFILLILLPAFGPSPWLNPTVFMINVDSVLNDVGMLLISGILTSALHNLKRGAIMPYSGSSSSTPSAVILARSQLGALASIPNKVDFTPPQQQPRGLRLKVIACILEESLFSIPKDGTDVEAPAVMNAAVGGAIDEDFVPVARKFFADCVVDSRRFVPEMREQYHGVRKGHLSIYADVLDQVRHEPTYAVLQQRSDKLVRDCARLGRPHEQSSKVLSELLQHGEAISKRYNRLMETVVSKTGAKFHKTSRKGLVRIAEKMALTPPPNNWKPERMCDIVRGSIECDSFTKMINVVRLLCDLDVKLTVTGETGGIAEKICITRSKGRFAKPTSGGWGDIMVNYYFEGDVNRHICEVQLVHTQLYTVRKNMGAHATYNLFRSTMELLTMVGEDAEEGTPPEELEALVWKGKRSEPENQLEKVDTYKAETLALRSKVVELEARADFLHSELVVLRAGSEAQKKDVDFLRVQMSTMMNQGLPPHLATSPIKSPSQLMVLRKEGALPPNSKEASKVPTKAADGENRMPAFASLKRKNAKKKFAEKIDDAGVVEMPEPTSAARKVFRMPGFDRNPESLNDNYTAHGRRKKERKLKQERKPSIIEGPPLEVPGELR